MGATMEIHRLAPIELPPEGERVWAWNVRGQGHVSHWHAGMWWPEKNQWSCGEFDSTAKLAAWTELPAQSGGAYRVRRLAMDLPKHGNTVLVFVVGKDSDANDRGWWVRGSYRDGLWHYVDNPAPLLARAWCELPEAPL